jgi:hypothetical protein
VVLEGDPDIRDRFRYALSRHHNVATATLQESRHHEHQGALSTSGRADYRDKFSGFDVDADFFEREKRVIFVFAKGLGRVADSDRDTGPRFR